MARRTRLPAEERRRQILDAAVELFRNRHYADISLDEVAEAAGVARGLINHHFGTKRDLYVEVVRRVVDVELVPPPDTVRGGTPRERVEHAVDAWLDVMEGSRDLFLEAVKMYGSGDEAVYAAVEEARERTARRIAELVGFDGDALSDEQLGFFRVLEGLGEAALIQWVEYGRLSRRQVRDVLIDAFTTGGRRIGGPARGSSAAPPS